MSHMPQPESLTLSMREAAAILGISPSTAYAAAKDDAFPVPVIKINSRYVVSKKSLMELLGLSPKDAA
ncbi:DNA-binding protein [Corynebacterium hylobatis]|uniref:DNA-binding protein n=1 Tax=Corynebacterium hylobatis TaxID=1859290 RepID=A0A430HUU0_9CORY|nr:helix-turn-helix domain-containing protein [Corynebacterium hylobatis]RSZ61244.1 DNA-binding protein [Corynebacterium hylobatis]